jgi:hypothetical protein
MMDVMNNKQAACFHFEQGCLVKRSHLLNSAEQVISAYNGFAVHMEL